MNALLQTGSSLSACGHAQAGGRVPVPPEKRFLINCKGPKSIRALQNAGHGIYYGVTCPEVSFKDAIR